MLNIEKEVATMRQMTTEELRKMYLEVFFEATNNRNRQWLIKRIAWRMQANEEGDLSVRARQRAAELANDANLLMNAPGNRRRRKSKIATARSKTATSSAQQLDVLLSGMELQRTYKGKAISVEVLDVGFSYNGEYFKSLTAVAQAITGKHWNGFHFFNLRNGDGK